MDCEFKPTSSTKLCFVSDATYVCVCAEYIVLSLVKIQTVESTLIKCSFVSEIGNGVQM